MGKKEQRCSQVLVVLATLNEEQGIGPTISEIKDVLCDPEILVVDGRSVDNTIGNASCFDVEVLRQLGSGKGSAIAEGIRFANFKGEYVVMVDADFTYPAVFIPQMIRILEEKPWVGMVCGNRFNGFYYRKGMNSLHSFGNRILALVHGLFNSVRLRDPLTGLRVVRWGILKQWKPVSVGFDIEVELNHFVEKQGFEIVEVPIGLRSRLGEKKLSVLDGLTILKRILMLGE